VAKDNKKNVGEMIKKYRLAAHLSQMALAEKMGISYQQLQKYENGINNISFYRLQQISDSLNIPLSAFFEGQAPEKISEEFGEYGLSKEEKILINLFRKIKNKDIKRGLLLELKGIAEEIKNR
jgi:transcriptional regulator with XRE-family HTH domain